MTQTDEGRGADAPTGKRNSVRRKHALQLFKTDMCKLFEQGMCKHGDRCAFAHNIDEVRHKPDLTRTSMCRVVLQGGTCQDPYCSFAHDKDSLRTTCGFFKTRMCNYARGGKCRNGDQCRFAHVPEELRPLAPPAPDEGAALQRSAHGQAIRHPLDWSVDGHGCSDESACSRNSSATEMPQSSEHTWRSSQSSSGRGGRPSGSGSLRGAQRVGVDGTTAAWGSSSQLAAAGLEGRRDPRPSAKVTTLLVTSVPKYLTQGALLSLFEDLYPEMRDNFDLFYCPWDEGAGENRGYALFNFTDASNASAFQRKWANKELYPQERQGQKQLHVERATTQGLLANVEFFSRAWQGKQMLSPDPRFRPLVRDISGVLQPLDPDMFQHQLRPLPGGRGWHSAQTDRRRQMRLGRGGAIKEWPRPPGQEQKERLAYEIEQVGTNGMLMWQAPQECGMDGVYGAAVQPMWPVQMAKEGEASPTNQASDAAQNAGSPSHCGQMVTGMECTYMVMPLEYMNTPYIQVVVAEPPGGMTGGTDMSAGAGWAPYEAEAVPNSALQWVPGVREDEVYSD